MPTDDERREVARRMLAVAKKLGPNMDAHEFAHYTADVLDVDENMTWYEMELRLADLIDPPDGFDLDTVQRVCFECMEGCDEPEWTLYTTIHDAIARYKRGESGPTYDREALLALADEMTVEKGDIWGWSSRIREALGVTVDE